MNTQLQGPSTEQFNGTIYLFHAFDIGEDINFNKLRTLEEVSITPSRYQNTLKTTIPHSALRCHSHIPAHAA